MEEGIGKDSADSAAASPLVLTEREEWLLGLMAHATAFALAHLFKPLMDVQTVEKTLMAMVEIHGGVYQPDNTSTNQTIDREK